MNTLRTTLCALSLAAAGLACAAPQQDMLRGFADQARQADPAFAGFSAERGASFFNARHGGEWSCASCHTEQPGQKGRHAKTGRDIQPLAPAANADRFTDPAKSDKWFRRNCNDVLGRICTPQEKGDVLTWLLRIGAGSQP